jgi:protein-L-isoaspartate(D-aspartate) O-methyltransferase
VTPQPKRARFPVALDRPAGPVAPPTATTLVRPQRPLAEAARDAARRTAPSGLGLDSAAVRARMLLRLRADGICDETLLAAFGDVLRHRFVDSALATQAYEDTSLPIGLGQTISKPSVVARMLALARATPAADARGSLGRVLEIGTGCGYQTALLARLARQVFSVERLKPLHDKAREHLADDPARSRIRLVWADGRLGHAPNAPYDTIVAAAGGEDLPSAWLDQLADGGRLVAPVNDGRGQTLVVVDRDADRLRRQRFESVLFVPLKSGVE